MPEYTTSSGLLMSHAILLLDGSGSMTDRELATGQPKHRAVAKMVQELINAIKEDPEIKDLLLTVICYDGNRVTDVRLSEYDIKESEEYYSPDFRGTYDDPSLDKWDPLIGHGSGTPIGRALGGARQIAEDWVQTAPEGALHRAVICLLSDGMNYPSTEPTGVE